MITFFDIYFHALVNVYIFPFSESRWGGYEATNVPPSKNIPAFIESSRCGGPAEARLSTKVL